LSNLRYEDEGWGEPRALGPIAEAKRHLREKHGNSSGSSDTWGLPGCQHITSQTHLLLGYGQV